MQARPLLGSQHSPNGLGVRRSPALPSRSAAGSGQGHAADYFTEPLSSDDATPEHAASPPLSQAPSPRSQRVRRPARPWWETPTASGGQAVVAAVAGRSPSASPPPSVGVARRLCPPAGSSVDGGMLLSRLAAPRPLRVAPAAPPASIAAAAARRRIRTTHTRYEARGQCSIV